MRTKLRSRSKKGQPTRVAIIGTVGIPARYGGFETLAEHLTTHLSESCEMTVYCSGKKYKKEERLKSYKGAKLVYIPLDANGKSSILYDCISILHALFFSDVLIVLGVSGGIMFPFVKWFTNRKLIVSIDGIEWKRAKWGKYARWYLWFAEYLAVKFSDADIADNEAIQDYTAIRYKSLSHIIEYGADHASEQKPEDADRAKYPFLSGDYYFSVCRIEPENNVHHLLDAFSQFPDKTYVFVGNWNHSDYGKSLREKYAGYSHILILDPVYDQRELDVLRTNCTAYVHGHSAGGTNPSLVEAMYLGCAVIAFGVKYNITTTQRMASYFKDVNSLKQILERIDPISLKQNAEMMKQIAYKRYTWATIAARYNHLVNQVYEGRPSKRLVSSATRVLRKEEFDQFGIPHLRHTYHFFEKR
jgi:glycosyltransferase involved in cell wall biosynthesis